MNVAEEEALYSKVVILLGKRTSNEIERLWTKYGLSGGPEICQECNVYLV